MSILIKGMEMPASCGECRFAGACGVHHIEEWPDIESIILNDVIGVGGVRDENCPLVPVPPHGRLIDADVYRDEFMAGVYDLCNDDPDNYRANAIIDLFDFAPTIIPAEEDE